MASHSRSPNTKSSNVQISASNYQSRSEVDNLKYFYENKLQLF
jgi:hypothetical protein